jgi:hypothetical protein
VKIDRFPDKEYWTVTGVSDLRHWEVIYAEDYKPGVKRLHVRNLAPHGEGSIPSFRLLYCPDEILEAARRQPLVTV